MAPRETPHDTKVSRDVFERHLQTILMSVLTVVVTGALLFAANYFYSDNRAQAVQQTQLEALTTQVLEMRGDLRLLRDSYVRREEMKDLDGRMRDVERYVHDTAKTQRRN